MIHAATFASAFDAAETACPRHHFLTLDASQDKTPARYGAAYCFVSDSGTRTVAFCAYGPTPEDALRGLVVKVTGLAVAA